MVRQEAEPSTGSPKPWTGCPKTVDRKHAALWQRIAGKSKWFYDQDKWCIILYIISTTQNIFTNSSSTADEYPGNYLVENYQIIWLIEYFIVECNCCSDDVFWQRPELSLQTDRLIHILDDCKYSETSITLFPRSAIKKEAVSGIHNAWKALTKNRNFSSVRT